MSSTCMRNVVIDVPFQSDRWGLTSAMPSPRPRSPCREREVARAAHARQDRRGRGRLGERLAREGGEENREDDTHEGADERAEDQDGDVDGRGTAPSAPDCGSAIAPA